MNRKRWRPDHAPDLEALERELEEERSAIQEEACTDEELSYLAALAVKGGTKRGRHFAVPNHGKVQKCSMCGAPIAWRRYGSKSIPLDLRTALEDRHGEQFARDHRGVCRKKSREVG